jgi:hypothetical protein
MRTVFRSLIATVIAGPALLYTLASSSTDGRDVVVASERAARIPAAVRDAELAPSRIAVANTRSRGGRAAVGGIQPKVDYDPTAGFEPPGSAGAAAVGDVTGDGRADMLVVSRIDADGRGILSVFAQTAAGGFAPIVNHELGAAYNFLDGGLVLSDLNRDDTLDAVVGMTNGIAVVLFRADGTASRQNVVLGREIRQVGALDIDRDGHQDAVGLSWGNLLGGAAPEAATLFFNDGAGGLQRAQAMETPQRGYNDLKVGDVTGDGHPDLVISSRQAFHFWVIPHNGDSGFSAARAYPNQHPIRTYGSVAIGDFNSDRRNDVAAAVWASIADSAIWVHFQNAAGGLDPPVRLASLDLPGPMLGHDLDNDARTDLVVLHDGGYEQIGRYRQVTAEVQPVEQLFPHTDSGNTFNRQGFAIGDINGDRCPDLVFADGLYGLLFKTGKACFTSRPQRIARPRPPGR